MEKHVSGNTKKFLFDLNDFDEEAIRRKAAEARRPTFSQEEMEASRLTGYEQGRVAGLKEAIGSQEEQIRDLLQQVVFTADRLAQDETRRLGAFIDQAVLISAQAIAKVAPALLEHIAVDQIAAFIRGVLEEQSKGQVLAIHVSPAREAAVRERLDKMKPSGQRGTGWTISADAALGDQQCRIEWTGGGAEWDPGRVSAAILQAITAHMPESMRAQVQAGVDAQPQTPHNESNAPGDVT